MSLFSLPAVLDLVAKASVILAVTGLVAAALRHASASARHLVWTLGLVSALIAPALSIALPRWELPIVRIASPATPVSPAAHDAPAPARHNTVAANGGSTSDVAVATTSAIAESTFA